MKDNIIWVDFRLNKRSKNKNKNKIRKFIEKILQNIKQRLNPSKKHKNTKHLDKYHKSIL